MKRAVLAPSSHKITLSGYRDVKARFYVMRECGSHIYATVQHRSNNGGEELYDGEEPDDGVKLFDGREWYGGEEA